MYCHTAYELLLHAIFLACPDFAAETVFDHLRGQMAEVHGLTIIYGYRQTLVGA